MTNSLNVNQNKSPFFFSRLSPLIPSVVFDTYWKFAAERQEIFFRRFKGDLWPWTNDEIMLRFKFTNAYRASDRVSQYLIKNVIYKGENRFKEVFFRTLLFKIFNKIETWKLLEDKLGEISLTTYSFELYNEILSSAMASGDSIYSAAYIMASPAIYGYKRKHSNHLKLLEVMIKNSLPEKIQDCRNMKNAFEILRACPSFGDFLAYQFLIDLNYSDNLDFDEMSFIIPGPGAKDGIKKCFSNSYILNETDIIKIVTERQEKEFERIGIEFKNLWGRKLHLIDCQNLFCEVDKYSRVAHPSVQGVSGRKKIKQMYRASGSSLDYFYPPKWGINQKIKSQRME